MAINFNQRIMIPAYVMCKELQGESVLLNLESERYFGLDQVGTQMWNILSKTDSIEQAFQILVEQYDVEPGMLRQDMNDLLESLIDQGLLETADAGQVR